MGPCRAFDRCVLLLCGCAAAMATAGCSRSGLGDLDAPEVFAPGERAGGDVAGPPNAGAGGTAQTGSAGTDGVGGAGTVVPPDIVAPPPDAVGGPGGSGDPFIPNGPQGGLREDKFCVGFGITVPVIDQPPAAGPFYCGLNCAYGIPCPLGLQCWGVFEPGVLQQLPSGDYVSPTDIVAYQCFPPDGACPPDQPPGTLCARCNSDADCR